ncbi:hypothetical protein [Formosa sp. L2A11]|uniref:hypothetical protein n=1 Tax=Formosa sp. L2A11 TaxID=2686363 RepID=UPI00131C5929|nr:hypothetical protein [Formosa sp. L2A11]
MSQVTICPTCGGTSKFKASEGKTIYQAIQDDDLLKKVGQLKKAMEKFKAKADALEKELIALKQA